MANHRSPKPGLQVRLLPLLLFSPRRQESKGAPTTINVAATERSRDVPLEARAATGALSDREGRRGRRLPLLLFSPRRQESKEQ